MIRFAEQRDLPAIYSLWETCFPDEGGFNGYFFSHLYEPQHTLLLMQENTLCAMLQMLPYTLSVNGELREITYIYGVCTHPSHRRRGYAAELLERSFALDKEKKRAASILIPAEEWLFEFYRPFGYTETFYLAPLTDANSRGVRTAAPSQRRAHPTDQRTLRSLVPAASYHARPGGMEPADRNVRCARCRRLRLV